MAWFSVNGVTIELALGSGKRESNIIGVRRRAFDGSLLQSASAIKDGLDFETTLMVRDDADALYALLMGYGHNFRFAAAGDYFSGKFLKETATSGSPLAGGASGKFDKRLTLESTEYVTWTPSGKDALTGDYTIACWWLSDDNPDDVWTHILVRRSGTAVTYYTDGILVDTEAVSAGPPVGDVTPDATPSWDAKMTVTSGVLKLLGEVTADTVDDAFSDLIALPFAVPTDWIPLLAAATRAFPNRPNVEASGDLLNLAATAPIECTASGVEFTPKPFVDPTAGETLDGGSVSFRLDEV